MSLLKRVPSPARSRASQENSLRSTGPRSVQGKANSSRNARKVYVLPPVVGRSMGALGERPGDFKEMHQALAEALKPRDAWEAAWVQDIAVLRRRLERLQKAEAGTVALRRRRRQNERLRAAGPATGSDALELNNMVGLLGFTGIPDSARKFQQVIETLNELRDLVRSQMFDLDAGPHFSLLYGKTPAPHVTMMKARFEALAKSYKEGRQEFAGEALKSLLADLSKEISTYKRLSALYAAEHLEKDILQQDAELLLPSEDLDGVIRYETHLEDQIERKLRQFYARRREPVLRRAEILPVASEESGSGELACKTASAGA